MDDKKSKIQIPTWGWLIISFLVAMALWFFLSVNEKTARSFPFLPDLGSRLYQVTRERPSRWQGLAERYVREALEEESELNVSAVEVAEGEGGAQLVVRLDWQGEALSVTVDL